MRAVIDTLIPFEYRQIASGAVTGVIIFAIMFMQIEMERKANNYTHYKVTVQPSGIELHLFEASRVTKRVRGILHDTIINLGVNIKDPHYGEVTQIDISHDYTWTDRVLETKSEKGLAKYKGIWVKHNTSYNITVCASRTPFGIDHAKVIPHFQLLFGSNDYHFKRTPPSPQMMATMRNGGISPAVLTKIQSKIRDLQTDNAQKDQLIRQQKSKIIELEGIGEERKAETQGLLGHKGGVMPAAHEVALTFFNAEGSWKKVVKQLQGRKWPTAFMTPALAVVIGVLIVVVALQFNPGAGEYVAWWLSQPFNLMIVAVIVVASFLGIYMIRKRRA